MNYKVKVIYSFIFILYKIKVVYLNYYRMCKYSIRCNMFKNNTCAMYIVGTPTFICLVINAISEQTKYNNYQYWEIFLSLYLYEKKTINK